jgi:hypothetical protein
MEMIKLQLPQQVQTVIKSQHGEEFAKSLEESMIRNVEAIANILKEANNNNSSSSSNDLYDWLNGTSDAAVRARAISHAKDNFKDTSSKEINPFLPTNLIELDVPNSLPTSVVLYFLHR